MNNSHILTNHALAIWRAGVQAVTPENLFRKKVQWHAPRLVFDELSIDLRGVRQLVVVGAGKASAAMAVALHRQVLAPIAVSHPRLRCLGWINAPAGTFSEPERYELAAGGIHLHAARPAGVNQPTEAAVEGTRKILELVRNCDQSDLVLCLLSGGGSAVLVAPKPGITLTDKQALAREVAAAGGDIDQLNTIRRAVSEVKGGGLARACRAGRLVTLIISDVLGDPLETIASGPTLASASCDPRRALDELTALGLRQHADLRNLVRTLQAAGTSWTTASSNAMQANSAARVEHIILGNNADAVDAAGVKAVELGYRYVMQSAIGPEGEVRQLAPGVVAAIRQLSSQHDFDCWISGGEPTVKLPANHGRGGRNQQLALAVLTELRETGWPRNAVSKQCDIAFVSGGTDGEDGPTDAAGAWFDHRTMERLEEIQLQPRDFLERADAYSFFDNLDGLLRTGPTGTNVCDLRIALCPRLATKT